MKMDGFNGIFFSWCRGSRNLPHRAGDLPGHSQKVGRTCKRIRRRRAGSVPRHHPQVHERGRKNVPI